MANPTELQPVDIFVVILQTTPIRSIIRARRQAEVPLLAPGESWEHETNETNLVVKITDVTKPYTVSVCAVNSLGRTCSTPQQIDTRREQLRIPKPEGLTSKEKEEPLSFPLVIAIAVIVPVVLLVLCVALVGMVVMCRCCGRSKEYYPARQGIPEGT